jgi:small redox-active disulfide protein 2
MTALHTQRDVSAHPPHPYGDDKTMKKIQILGTGCPKCQKLSDNAKAAADQLGLDYQIEKITDLSEITRFGVMITPALAVDGKVISTGRVLDVNAIKPLIQE